MNKKEIAVNVAAAYFGYTAFVICKKFLDFCNFFFVHKNTIPLYR